MANPHLRPSRLIASIGYAGLPRAEFERIASAFRLIIDTRSIPQSRIAGWNRSQLVNSFPQYVWKGDVLGGRPPYVQPAGLDYLRTLTPRQHPALLICLERVPDDCHRHHDIASALLPTIDVAHVIDDEVVMASELQRAVDAAEDLCEVECSLTSLMRSLRRSRRHPVPLF